MVRKPIDFYGNPIPFKTVFIARNLQTNEAFAVFSTREKADRWKGQSLYREDTDVIVTECLIDYYAVDNKSN